MQPENSWEVFKLGGGGGGNHSGKSFKVTDGSKQCKNQQMCSKLTDLRFMHFRHLYFVN